MALKLFKIKSGLTLIEVLLAMSILTIGILAVIQLFPLGLNMSRLNKNETIAINLAQAKMEEIRANSYDDIINEDKNRISTNPDNPYYNFKRQTEVTFVNENLETVESDSGLKKITVSIYWPEQGEEKSISQTSLKHQ